jgi:hypothetical protein
MVKLRQSSSGRRRKRASKDLDHPRRAADDLLPSEVDDTETLPP